MKKIIFLLLITALSAKLSTKTANKSNNILTNNNRGRYHRRIIHWRSQKTY